MRIADVAATGQESAVYRESMDHPSDDDYWKSMSTREHIKDIRIPVFAVGGWYDNYAESDLEAFEALHKHGGLNRVLIGPWPHNMSIPFKNVSFGAESSLPIRRFQLQWFDHWLKGVDTPLDVAAAGGDLRDGRQRLAAGERMAAGENPATSVSIWRATGTPTRSMAMERW